MLDLFFYLFFHKKQYHNVDKLQLSTMVQKILKNIKKGIKSDG